MITCTIGGERAVPVLGSGINITVENAYISDKEEYTYDITFPLDILENRRIFGPVGRIGTSKKRRSFENVSLVCDNMEVIRGRGVVTESNQKELKMQVLAGYSRIKYMSAAEGKFIDKMEYPLVPQKYRPNVVKRDGAKKNLIDVTEEVRVNKVIGDVATAVFMPVYDNSNGMVANNILPIAPAGANPREYWSNDNARLMLFNRAVQPNLMMVLRNVVTNMGYTIEENEYDRSPWNELVICSAKQTDKIARALPHWTVAKFLKEFCNLFNAVMKFDDTRGTVRILHRDFSRMEMVEYEVADEFTTNYEEDAIEYIGISNLRYRLSGLGDSTVEVPDEVWGNFEVRQFASLQELTAAFQSMTNEEKLTTLMETPRNLYYGTEMTDDNGDLTGEVGIKEFGIFSQLMRDDNSDNEIELSMCPVEMSYEEWNVYLLAYNRYFPLNYYTWQEMPAKFWLPVVDNDEVVADPGTVGEKEDDNERTYVSIEDIVESGKTANQEETDATIQLMWVAGQTERPLDGGNRLTNEMPSVFSDWRIGLSGNAERSMALTRGGENSIGAFHNDSIHINAGGDIDGNNEVCIDFLCSGKPDPGKIFVFQGKSFLCSKIEMKIGENGMDPLKRGYFYEILE